MRKIYARLSVLILFSLTSASAYAIEFKNFSNQVVLTPVSNDQYLYNDGVTVKLTNRIVVKAAGAVTKEQLAGIDQRVTSVQALYTLKSSAYYVVTFSDKNNLAEILARFEASPLIHTAQPDLLQLHEKAGRPALPQRSTDYIEKLDISSLWQITKGENVKIAIIDDGFDLSHEDMQGVKLSFGYDLDTKTLDPSPRTAIDTHGTQVAGIIFARHNGIGIDGIAPNAEVIAIRHTDTWTSKTILSFYLAKLAGADIINCSWNARILLEPLGDVINDLTVTGRQGKGIALVFAAGNHGLALEDNSCESTLPRVIAVGSKGSSGNRLPFSNYGEGVDFFTFGEDILAPARGPKKYAVFSGTSASAAIVSGVAALLLSQNSAMTITALQEQLSLIFGAR